MSLKGRDNEFRTPRISYLDFKHIEMDRVLTMLFPRLKYDGYGSRRPPRGGDLSVEVFRDEFLKHPEWFAGFDAFPEVVYRWIETDPMDVVNRGKTNQAVAAPRPLHGNTYKFRNARHTRDYGAAEQIYWMLFYARKTKGQAARDALKQFFFPGIDLVMDRYDPNIAVDVETQAILRLDHQVAQDMKDSKEPERHPPLCIGQADLLADDILRLLAYEPYIPRSVLVDYLKTLMAFHLALYHMRLLFMLPRMVKQRSGGDPCSPRECPVHPGNSMALDGCPYQVPLMVDMGDPLNEEMHELARRSADRVYRQIPAFVQANFVVKSWMKWRNISAGRRENWLFPLQEISWWVIWCRCSSPNTTTNEWPISNFDWQVWSKQPGKERTIWTRRSAKPQPWGWMSSRPLSRS